MNEKLKNVMLRIYQNPIFIVLLLLLTVFFEWSFNQFISVNRFEYDFSGESFVLCSLNGGSLPLCLFLILIIIMTIGLLCRCYSISPLSIRSFLNNSLGVSWLSFAFALVFLVHISWICDSGFDIVLKNEDVGIRIWSILIALLNLFFLFVIFSSMKLPRRIQENANQRNFMVSCISTPINTRNIQPLAKPLVKYKNVDTLLILLSNELLHYPKSNFRGEKYQPPKFLEYYLTEVLGVKKEELLSYREEHKDELIDLEIVDILMNDYLIFLDENKFSKENSKRYVSTVEEKITLFLKAYILFFHKITIKNVFFTEPVDANDLEKCYPILNNYISLYEKDDSKTIINITPGTASVSGAMSILAIKGARQLVYVRQDNSEVCSVNLDVWNTSELLSELWNEYENRKGTSLG